MSQSDDFERLRRDFLDREYRDAYAQDFLYTSIAAQIMTLREQRGLTQKQLAERIGSSQPHVSRIERYEDSGNANWSLETLRRIAAALDLRLRVSFESFGSLVSDSVSFSRESLQRSTFEQDEVFRPLLSPSEEGVLHLEPVERLQEQFRTWLAGDGSVLQLGRWLAGYDLPATGDEEPPFRWLLRAIPLGGERFAVIAELARRIRELLLQFWNFTVGPDPEEYRYNLLQIAAGLQNPHQLQEPLFSIFSTLRDGAHASDELRDALTGALIRNQEGDLLRQEWVKFLDAGSHPILPGDEYTGFAGIRSMAWTRSGQRVPDVDAIGMALKVIAAKLESEAVREQRFADLCRDLHEMYRDAPGFSYNLILQSKAWDWPPWAADQLPEYFAVMTDEKDGVIEGVLALKPQQPIIFTYAPKEQLGTLQLGRHKHRMPNVSQTIVMNRLLQKASVELGERGRRAYAEVAQHLRSSGIGIGGRLPNLV